MSNCERLKKYEMECYFHFQYLRGDIDLRLLKIALSHLKEVCHDI